MYAQLDQRSRKLRELDKRSGEPREQLKTIEKVKKKPCKSKTKKLRALQINFKNKLISNQRFWNSNKVLMKINPQIITR